MKSVAVLGLLCTALALLLYFWLISQAGAARASVVAYIHPTTAAILGVFALNKPVGVHSALGLGMILLGSWLATHKARAAHTAAQAPAEERA